MSDSPLVHEAPQPHSAARTVSPAVASHRDQIHSEPRIHIVWDWNGTLKDDLDDLVDAMNATLAALGEDIRLSRQQYLELHCVPIPAFYTRILGRELTTTQWATAEAEFARFLATRKPRLRDDAPAALARLHKRGATTQSVLSLLPHAQLLSEVRQLRVDHLFARIDGRTTAQGVKTQALRGHLDALAWPQDEYHRVLLIGDTLDDAHAAHAVGASAVLVTGGLEADSSLQHSGIPVASSLRQAVAIALNTPAWRTSGPGGAGRGPIAGPAAPSPRGRDAHR